MFHSSAYNDNDSVTNLFTENIKQYFIFLIKVNKTSKRFSHVFESLVVGKLPKT